MKKRNPSVTIVHPIVRLDSLLNMLLIVLIDFLTFNPKGPGALHLAMLVPVVPAAEREHKSPHI